MVLSKLFNSPSWGLEAESSPCHTRLPPNIATVCFFRLSPETPCLFTPQFSYLESLALPPVGVLAFQPQCLLLQVWKATIYLQVLIYFLLKTYLVQVLCNVTAFLRPRIIRSALCVLTSSHIFICI